MPMLRVRCPHCKSTLSIKNLAGESQTIQCPSCDTSFRVKAPEPKVEVQLLREPEEVDEIVDEYEEVPRRRSVKRSRPERTRRPKQDNTVLWVVGGGFALVLIVLAIVFLRSSRSDFPTVGDKPANELANDRLPTQEDYEKLETGTPAHFMPPNKTWAFNFSCTPSRLVNHPKLKPVEEHIRKLGRQAGGLILYMNYYGSLIDTLSVFGDNDMYVVIYEFKDSTTPATVVDRLSLEDDDQERYRGVRIYSDRSEREGRTKTYTAVVNSRFAISANQTNFLKAGIDRIHSKQPGQMPPTSDNLLTASLTDFTRTKETLKENPSFGIGGLLNARTQKAKPRAGKGSKDKEKEKDDGEWFEKIVGAEASATLKDTIEFKCTVTFKDEKSAKEASQSLNLITGISTIGNFFGSLKENKVRVNPLVTQKIVPNGKDVEISLTYDLDKLAKSLIQGIEPSYAEPR